MVRTTTKLVTAPALSVLSSQPVNLHFARRRLAQRNLLLWSKRIVLATALLSLLAVGMGVTLWHQDTPGTVCSICYAAHLPAMRSLPVRMPVSSYAIAWLVPIGLPEAHPAPERNSSSPRAPPA